jgi:hypothetical protein
MSLPSPASCGTPRLGRHPGNQATQPSDGRGTPSEDTLSFSGPPRMMCRRPENRATPWEVTPAATPVDLNSKRRRLVQGPLSVKIFQGLQADFAAVKLEAMAQKWVSGRYSRTSIRDWKHEYNTTHPVDFEEFAEEQLQAQAYASDQAAIQGAVTRELIERIDEDNPEAASHERKYK